MSGAPLEPSSSGFSPAPVKPAGLLRRIAYGAAGFLLAFLAIECVLHIAVRPSDLYSGTLFGIELLPMKLLPEKAFIPRDPTPIAARPVEIHGMKLTFGDLWGFHREDPVTGYAHVENAVSANGWWRSNTLGARADREYSKEKPAGVFRALFFGESFAQGSRVKQTETIEARLEGMMPGSEIVNFAVDGYSLAQAYLRFLLFQDRLDYDAAVAVLVPTEDLWRDINVMRALRKWPVYLILPRFILKDGKLELVPSPYPDSAAMLAGNRQGPSPKFIEHLRRYDRYYSPLAHQPAGILDWFVTFRILRTILWSRSISVEHNLRPDSEAVQVEAAIVRAMSDETEAKGKKFLLVLLPGTKEEMRRYGSDARFRASWDSVRKALCPGAGCLDLMAPMARAAEKIDKGVDGSHYGPEANKIIASLIRDALMKTK